MKSIKKSLKFILILILFTNIQAQETTEFNQITKLSTLAKVWGLLKYFHPRAGSGDIRWDDALVDVIGQVKDSQNIQQFNEALYTLIEKAGNISFLNFPDLSHLEDQKSPVHSWIQDNSLLEWYTAFKLEILISNFQPFTNHYVTYTDQVGNTEFKGELRQRSSSTLSEEFRLLSLFRYWNIIYYFYPNKHLLDKKWEDVLEEFIPKFQNSNTNLEYHLTVKELTTQINDSHASTYSMTLYEFWGTLYPPFETKYINGKTVIFSVYENLLDHSDQLLPGDIITHIGDKAVEKIRNEQRKYIGASNPPGIERNLNKVIFKGNNQIMELTISRNGFISKVSVNRYEWGTIQEQIDLNEQRREKWKILDGNIGYIDMGILQNIDVSPAMNSLMDTKALIIDIRNYPEFIVYDICNYLHKEPKTFYLWRYPDPKKIGEFRTIQPATSAGHNNKHYYRGKVILLVDETTQSSAEFTCMAIQTAPDVTTIGSQTAGADGNVSYFYLPGGIYTYFSGCSPLYPDGRETQRVGIDIDIISKPSIQGIADGKDEVLDRAIEYINQSLENEK